MERGEVTVQDRPGPPMKIVFGLGGEILRSTCAQGHGRNGTQALFTLFKCCGW